MVSGRSATVGLVVITLAGCARNDDHDATPPALGDDAITVGSFAFPESVLLAEVYSQALEAHGFDVERAFGLGPREFVGPALSAGLIELVPEYVGTALAFHSVGSVRPSAGVGMTHRQLVGALAGSDVTVLESAPAENANTFVVSRDTARRYGLERLSDLIDMAGILTFGGPAECASRPHCLQGLEERYGLQFDEVLTLDEGGPLTRQALSDGGVDVALMFTTDPALRDYVELVDDKRLQPAENVTPLVRDEVVDRWGPDIAEVIDAVSRQLTTETLRDLNATDADDPGSGDVAAIATAWLQAKGPP